ncbi:MAG: 4'-phosphopantetheinyl transferase superfamily protein [Anaerocolumna sp.]
MSIVIFSEVEKNTDFKPLFSLVSKERKDRLLCFKDEAAQHVGLLSDVIIRYCLFAATNYCNGVPMEGKNKYGKPQYLNYKDFEFNLSHTENALVCCISENSKAVGIDIEKITDIEEHLDIAEHFFTIKEQNYLNQFNGDTNLRFLEMWTRKEAYSKQKGKGLLMPYNSFEVYGNELIKMKTVMLRRYIISECSDLKEADIKLFILSNDFIWKHVIPLLQKIC